MVHINGVHSDGAEVCVAPSVTFAPRAGIFPFSSSSKRAGGDNFKVITLDRMGGPLRDDPSVREAVNGSTVCAAFDRCRYANASAVTERLEQRPVWTGFVLLAANLLEPTCARRHYLTRRHKPRRPRRSSLRKIPSRIASPSTNGPSRSTGGHWEGDLIICRRIQPLLVLH
jgi:hypothetical protein